MSSESAGAAKPQARPATGEPTVTVLNSDPFLRTVLLPGEGGVQRPVSIPPGKVDKFHKTTPGRVEVTAADWELIKKHPTAKHLVKAGTLSLLAGG